MPSVEPGDILRALRGGPATLDALAARLHEPERDGLVWALDEAVSAGWVHSSGAVPCGPDGLCGSSAPGVFTLAPAERKLPPTRDPASTATVLGRPQGNAATGV